MSSSEVPAAFNVVYFEAVDQRESNTTTATIVIIITHQPIIINTG